VGPTPFGSRRVAPIAGGTFEGPQLSGIVLPGGTDWITEDAAGCWFRINVRVPLRTHDGDLLTMAYQGFRSGPPEVLAKVSRGESVDADSYYYRVSGFFETASPSWLASTRWLSSPAAGGPPSVQDTTSSRCSDRKLSAAHRATNQSPPSNLLAYGAGRRLRQNDQIRANLSL